MEGLVPWWGWYRGGSGTAGVVVQCIEQKGNVG